MDRGLLRMMGGLEQTHAVLLCFGPPNGAVRVVFLRPTGGCTPASTRSQIEQVPAQV